METNALINEIWKIYPKNHNYEVSTLGRVRRATNSKPAGDGAITHKKGFIRKSYTNPQGYCRVELTYDDGAKRKHFVHRLVLETFVGPCPPNHEANHKDGVKAGNELLNLEWVTPKENTKHAYQTGLRS